MQDRYAVRRFVAFGTGCRIGDGTVSAVESALLKALSASGSCIGVAVIEPEGEIMQHIGHIPLDAFKDCAIYVKAIDRPTKC